ncbi:MAG: menaquinone biosynthesis decarboxylase [Campylobacterales bacterium]
MNKLIDRLKEKNLIRVIDTPLDVELEIPHVAYIEAKKPNPKALLFTHPKDGERELDIPVMMNIFGSFELTRELLGDEEVIAKEITSLLKLSKVKSIVPKYLKQDISKTHRVIKKDELNLFDLPILKTWEQDGGRFITMGQLYAQSMDGNIKNVGMYRLQVYDKDRLGLHWQIHKDSKHFFEEYKKAGLKMPVSIGLGGNPLYTWCATAPMPYGMFELMLYGFITGRSPELIKSATNPIYVPKDVDIVIEGHIDPFTMVPEGPFGDHTGYYTPVEEYPVLEVDAICIKQNPIYYATVVGKPPLEDKYFGYITERIFLPLLQMSAPALLDYRLPENGVFHNLIIAKSKNSYPGEAKQLMHALWGAGQMSFVKHALFVGEDAPELEEDEALLAHILNRLELKNIIITEGVCDALDHSSPEYAYGGKLGVDCTQSEEMEGSFEVEDEKTLLSKLQDIDSEFRGVKNYGENTKNPLTIISLQKSKPFTHYKESLERSGAKVRVAIFIDCENNDLENPYMLLWRVVNNIDAKRDIFIEDETIYIDATKKGESDGFSREWPDDVHCSKSVLEKLKELKVIELSEKEERKFGLTPFSGC